MNLNIKTTNISLTPETKNYLEKKLMMIDKLVHLDQDNVFIYAELGKTTRHHRAGDIFRAEVNMQIGGKKIYVEAEEESLYAAIDKLKDELEEKLKSDKDKKTSLLRRGGRQVKNVLRFGGKLFRRNRGD
jgi:putative sigma-54 modulation protein